MFQNYLKIAFRNLLNNKLFSLINIFGLSVGLTAVILILLYLRNELSYDNFHDEGDSIYRVSVITKRGAVQEEDSYVFTPPIGPEMKEAFPEVKQYTRLSSNRPMYAVYNKTVQKLDDVCYADSTFFRFFSFDLLKGNPEEVLKAPYSMVLTESVANRLFGDQDPLGAFLKLDDEKQYEIKGIVKDLPANSHLQFDALISFETLFRTPGLFLGWNGGNQYVTYLKLQDQVSPEPLEAKFPGFMWEKINREYEAYGLELQPYLQPLSELHLYQNAYSKSLRTNLIIFAAIGLLILFIACVNFINLTTARASRRAKEIGLRKVLGANRTALIQQFLGESFLTTFLAFVVALVLVIQFYPVYGTLMGKQLSLESLMDWQTIGMLALLLIGVGLVAGSYPAFYLSSLKIVENIKGWLSKGRQTKQYFRNTLVVFQFAISAMLIVSTIVISRQLYFLQNKELGFEEEQMLIIPLMGEQVHAAQGQLKQDLLGLAQVKNVTAASEVPGDDFTSNGYIPEGQEQPIMINVVDVDEDFLEAFELELTQGRFFSPDRPTDREGYLVNESFVRMMNWADPIGKVIRRNGDHRVIGVVKDFHFAPLHSEIKPLILTNQPWDDRFGFIAVQLQAGQMDEALAAVQRSWEKAVSDTPMNFWFLDESIDQIYRTEVRFRKMFMYFSILSILIALLGMWGLATLTIRQRTKEVGVRKVLGATEGQLIGLLSKNFLLLVGIALIVAFPLAWLGMNRWMENFAYHTSISWWIFLISGVLVLLFAFAVVAIRALYAARIDPVQALRYE